MPEPAPQPSETQHRDRLAAAVIAAGHGVWDWNLRDRVAWYSPGLRAMLGHDEASFPDRFETFAGAVHPEDAGRLHGAIANHLQRQGGFDLEFRMRTGEGSWKWVRARGSAMFEGPQAVRMNGVLTEWPLSAARDRLSMSASDRLAGALEDQARVSRELEKARADLLRQNDELRRARSAAEAATRSKTMFLANMSHEIRTPMNAIVLSIPLLLDDAIDADKHREHGDAIRRSSDHLGELINDVLDLSKIEAGGMAAEVVPVDPLVVIADCLAVARPLASKQRLEVHAAVRGPVPAVIHSDPHRLRQILMNLLSNAIKFTEHGGVTVDVDLVRTPAPPREEPTEGEIAPAPIRLRVLVTDTGIGIE
ncbi:MAG: histidine kinase dimerization/phospho-acceptor domain-containing protein, partial [Planctomycetota bacterium]